MPLFFPPNLGPIAKIATRDNQAPGASTRFATTAVRIEDLGGSYRIETTDGRRLLIVRGPLLPASAPPDEAFAGAAVTLVPAAAWKEAFTKMGRARSVALVVDDEEFRLSIGGKEIAGQTVHGRFPPTDSALPKRPALWTVRVDPAMLAELLSAVAAMEPVNGVTLLYFGPGKPLGLLGQTEGGQFIDGLLMPLT